MLPSGKQRTSAQNPQHAQQMAAQRQLKKRFWDRASEDVRTPFVNLIGQPVGTGISMLPKMRYGRQTRGSASSSGKHGSCSLVDTASGHVTMADAKRERRRELAHSTVLDAGAGSPCRFRVPLTIASLFALGSIVLARLQGGGGEG